jgi:hypothetical protein
LFCVVVVKREFVLVLRVIESDKKVGISVSVLWIDLVKIDGREDDICTVLVIEQTDILIVTASRFLSRCGEVGLLVTTGR